MAPRKYEKSLPLPELEKRVNKTEQAKGPMTEMDRTTTHSVFQFAGGPPPATKVKLVQLVSGVAAQPPGSTKICESPLWSAGVRIDAVAYRL
jgi:hypothetical protein